MIRFAFTLRPRLLSSIFGIGFLLGGCPKRQTTPRLVYVPAPPSATTPASQESTEALVIEEPPPPPPPTPEETVPAVLPPPRPAHRPRHIGATEGPDNPEGAPEPDEPPTSVEVPALEPRESREKESADRTKILALQNEVERQIAQLEAAKLAVADRKTLDDARIFLGQSRKALEEADLQRSLNLAYKASLLVSALKKH